MIEKYSILILFLFVLVFVAYRSYKNINSYEDFNLAGRRTKLLPLVGSLGAAEFNTATLIGGASVAFSYGTVGIWYTSFIFIPVFGIYAFAVAKKYRRLNISTIAEFFDRRFKGRNAEATRAIASLVTLSFTWIAPATYLAGLSVVGSILLDINPLTFVIVLTVICFILSLAGGLITAIWSDVVAYIMILIGVPILLIIGWNVSGGLESLSNVYDPQFLSFEPVWDLEDYGFAAVLTWGFQNILLYIAAPWYGQRVFSAKNEKVAFKAMICHFP